MNNNNPLIFIGTYTLLSVFLLSCGAQQPKSPASKTATNSSSIPTAKKQTSNQTSVLPKTKPMDTLHRQVAQQEQNNKTHTSISNSKTPLTKENTNPKTHSTKGKNSPKKPAEHTKNSIYKYKKLTKDYKPYRPPSKTSKSKPLPKLSLNETTFHFDTISSGKVVEHRFFFSNLGQAPLEFKNGYATCGCTNPTFPKEPIKPGQASYIYISFNTRGKTGDQDAKVYFQTNESQKEITLHLKGYVKEATVKK